MGHIRIWKNYHSKVLSNKGNLTLKNYHTLDQSGKDKYNTAARELIVSCLIIKNSISTRVQTYLKDQYVMNQSNHPDKVITIVAMITLFGIDFGPIASGDGGNTI